MEKYIIALDQGTTSSRCIVFDREERIVAMAGEMAAAPDSSF